MNPVQEATALILQHGFVKALEIAARRLGEASKYGSEETWHRAELIECYIQGYGAGCLTGRLCPLNRERDCHAGQLCPERN